MRRIIHPFMTNERSLNALTAAGRNAVIPYMKRECGPGKMRSGRRFFLALAVAASFALWGATITSARWQIAAQSQMLYHNGPVMQGSSNVYFIWYGDWSGGLPGSSPETQTILTELAASLGASPYFKINTTYPDSLGNSPSGALFFAGQIEDPYSHGKQLTATDIEAVVSDHLLKGDLPVDANGIYIVFGTSDVGSDATGFCQPSTPPPHGFLGFQGAQVKYAFVGNAARCPTVAAAQFVATDGGQLPTPNGNLAADAMASTLARALDDIMANPLGNGWFDASGLENAEKCQDTFGSTYTTANGAHANMRLGSRDFLIQQNWVNQGPGYCGLKIDNAPIANDQSISTDEETPKSFMLTASDADADNLQYSIVTGPQHGTLTVTGASQEMVTYTANPNYNGADSFTFKADDGKLDSNIATVSITINPQTPITNAALDGFDPNANGLVRAIVVQADGKILIGGDFTALAPNGGATVARNYLARLNADGTVDASFDPNANSSVNTIAVQANGKILIGGDFSALAPKGGASVTRNRIARLNVDGTLDTTFDPRANVMVNAIVVQPDGKIVIGGDFTALAPNGGASITRNRIARLNADGTVDISFDPNASNTINAIALQTDGKITVAGRFTALAPNGGGMVTRNFIARLNLDGTVDADFNPNANNFTLTVAVQADGKILAGGVFTALAPNGAASVARNRIARLNTDGTLDTAFNPNADGALRVVTVQADGKIILGGSFTSLTPNGGARATRNCIARLNMDGTVDAAFNPNANNDIYAIALQSDVKIVVGGAFTGANSIRGQTRNRIARLEADGRLDQTLDLSAVGSFVSATAVQSDGKILIGGLFNRVLGAARNHIARLNTDGTLDTTFDPNASHTVNAIVVQADGKILIGGDFNELAPNGGATVARNYLARLKADGTVDTSFDPNLSNNVASIAVQPDGKIVIGGLFKTLAPGGGASVTRNHVARLNADGTVDAAFDPNANDSLVTIALQPDGKIVIGGNFTALAPNGAASVARNHIARLNGDGTLDTTFDPNARQTVNTIVVLPNGKILVGGHFFSLTPNDGASVTRNHIARLNADGTLDAAFDPNADDAVNVIAVQSDGKIVIGGFFKMLAPGGGASIARNYLARLKTDGTVDGAFDPDANSVVYAVTLQADGKILAGGSFNGIAGQTRNLFARLKNDAAAIQNLSATQTTLTWTRAGAAPHLSRVIFEQSIDGVTYSFLGNGTRIGTTSDFTLTGLNLPTQQNLYVRARGFYRGGYLTGSEAVTESVRNIFLPLPLHLAFGQQPTNSAASSLIHPAVTIQILDASNNLVNSTAAVTIGIGTNPSAGTLSGTLTVAAVNGTATFSNLSIDKAGTGYILTASGTDLMSAVSAPFNIRAGAPSSIGVAAGSGQSATIKTSFATALQATVTDALGNPVDFAEVTFSAPASGASGTFANNTTTTTVVTDASGVATASVFTANGSAGPYAVTASINSGATSTAFSLINIKANQQIAITTHAPSGAAYHTQFTVAATTSSGLGVVYGGSGSCTNNGATFTMTSSEGTCTVTYSQPGDSNYNAATPQVESIAAQKRDQTITFDAPADKTYGDADFDVSATASSGLPVSFAASGDCTVRGRTVHLTGAGSCTITSSQAGDGNHTAAPDISRSFNAAKAASTTTITISDATYDGQPHGGAATAIGAGGLSQNLSITYTGRNSTVYSSTTAPTNAGDYTASASYGGDANHNSSNDSKDFQINKGTPVITWSNPADITYGTALSDTQLNATANASGAFAYTPPSGTVLNAGTHQLSVAFTPTETANYTTATASVSIRVDPVTATEINLDSSSYVVGEADGHITMTVNRTGDTSSAATVDYMTSDTAALQDCNVFNGIASSRCDYATTVGTLRFAAGETAKQIFIPIVDDSYAEGPETFSITLSNAQGESLGAVSTATITIVDNDAVMGVNPLTDQLFFIRQQYVDFLGREPDPIGYQGWQDILNNCPPSGVDPSGNHCDRIEISGDFFRSEEFQERGFFIYRFYKTLPGVTDSSHPEFGHIPHYREFMPDLARVSGFLSAQQLEEQKVAFLNDFMNRAEFQTKYGALTDPAGYVSALLETVGLPNHPNRQTWIDALTNGSLPRAQVLRALVESSEFAQKNYNEAFVIMQYFGYLRRDPDSHYAEWIQTLNQMGDYRVMINGFLNSVEYRQRFGP